MRLVEEITEEFKQNPIKLLWSLMWFLPIHLTAIFLSMMVGISSLSWNEGVKFYWRLIK